MRVAIGDSSAIFASLDASDAFHLECLDALRQSDLRVVIPALAITEVCQLLERRVGQRAAAVFVASLAENDVRAPAGAEWIRIAELVRQYADFPLGAVDASVVALAERLDTDLVVTLDRRHFSAVRPNHCEHLRLLP